MGGVCRYVPVYDREIKNSVGSSRTNRQVNDVLSVPSCHVETVALLSKLKTEKHIDMELNMNEFNRYEE